jgi:hypothetical protein
MFRGKVMCLTRIILHLTKQCLRNRSYLTLSRIIVVRFFLHTVKWTYSLINGHTLDARGKLIC